MAEMSTLKRGAKLKKFAELSEEEIVLAAKSGNHKATEEIIARYKDFVKLRARSFFLAGADHEDVVQEGMIGLYKAVLSFEPGKGASFKTFAELCIDRQIMSAVKGASRKKHQPLNTYVPIHRQNGEAGSEEGAYPLEKTECSPEQIVLEREHMRGIHGQIDKALSRFEAEVLMHHLSGISYVEIARLLGREPKAVDNALQRIKRKLEKFLLG